VLYPVIRPLTIEMHARDDGTVSTMTIRTELAQYSLSMRVIALDYHNTLYLPVRVHTKMNQLLTMRMTAHPAFSDPLGLSVSLFFARPTWDSHRLT
jgi:hypothetical protein